MKIFVGNLSSKVTDADLRKLFSAHGRVESAQVIQDRLAGNPLGVGVVLMPSRPAAVAAIAGLHGYKLKGHILEVKEVRVPPKRPPGQIHRRTKVMQRGGGSGQKGAIVTASSVSAALGTSA